MPWQVTNVGETWCYLVVVGYLAFVDLVFVGLDGPPWG